jgi:hypothetical protein
VLRVARRPGIVAELAVVSARGWGTESWPIEKSEKSNDEDEEYLLGVGCGWAASRLQVRGGGE